ncbi:MAG: G5 domain-containing protein [Actinomycetota bacterium]|nr:G5 domain-containing protein [Actinomycetota bacterium]
MAKGQTKTVQQGHPGKVSVTYRQQYVDGAKSGSPVENSRATVSSAVATIVHVGTKVAAPPAAKITYSTFTESQSTSQPGDQRVNDSSMAEGTTKVVQQGHPGKVTITYKQKYVNGAKSGSPVEISRQTTTSAVATIIHIGTKPKPAATWVYNGSTASGVASAVNQYRISQGKSSLPHSSSSSLTPDTSADIHSWGNSSPSSIVAAWAASPEHRIAMLDDFDTRITCGYWTMSDGSKGPYSSCTLG